ncbi:hypothetical protein V6N13_137996 [Hibiscus sabdariffa]
MVNKLPRNHYVHVYLEEVLTASSATNVEPINVEVSDAGSFEPEINVEVSDAGSFEPEIYVEVSDVACSFELEFNVEVNDVDGSFEPDFNVEDNDVADMRVDIDDDSGHSDSLHIADESDSDGPRRKQRFPDFNTTVDISDPTFKVGLLFATKQVLKEVVKMYSIKNRYSVKLKRNDNRRIQAVCKAGCPSVLWASPVDIKEPYGTWQIKSLIAEHRCLKEYKNPNITSKFMAKQYLDAFHIDLIYSTKSLKQDVFRDYSISVHLSKCSRAKNLALERLHGNVKEQYIQLYDYLAELRSSNSGTTTILQLNETVFERLYICMQAMKDGFKVGWIDGSCDGIVSSAEHRTCVRHLYNNFKLDGDHKRKALKDQLWKTAMATYVGEFEAAMAILQMILEARDKSIITLVESIRSTLMQRIVKKKAEAEKLTGIPCIHVISVILLLEEKSESYVDPCYSVSTQTTIYSHFITPVRGENQWTRQHGMIENVLPPILRRPPGRPHKKRRREADEAPSQGDKVSKKGLKIYCTKCGGSRHNTRTCKGPVRENTRTHQKSSTATRRIPKLPDQSTTPSPRPSQSDIHPQSNIPRPSQPLPPYTVRWMSTSTVPFTQEPHTASPSQSDIHPQRNIPRPSQSLTPPYTIRWMTTPTIPLTQESLSLNHLHKILLKRDLGVTLDSVGIAKLVF